MMNKLLPGGFPNDGKLHGGGISTARAMWAIGKLK
jgi:hypothetical protein